jgi:hypothetical protein
MAQASQHPLHAGANRGLQDPGLNKPKAKNLPSEIDDVADKEFFDCIPRLCGSDDPLGELGLFLTGGQGR